VSLTVKFQTLDVRLSFPVSQINKQMACPGKLVKSQKPQWADMLHYLTMRLKESTKVTGWLDITQ
jgi:hypothetical protein